MTAAAYRVVVAGLRFAALRASGIMALGALWELAPRAGWVDATFFPPLTRVLSTLGAMALDGSLASHVVVSAFRGVLGFALAAALGVPLGLALGWGAPRAYAVLEPTLRIASQVNPFALMPVFLLFLGSGELVKVVAVGWVALWPVLFYTATGAAGVDPGLVKSARALCVSPLGIALRVVLPSAVPTLFVGLRLATGLVFFMLVAAEMLGATRGLGWFVHRSAMSYQIAGIYAGALAVMVLGALLAVGVRGIERRLFVAPWSEPAASDTRPPARRAVRRPVRIRHGVAAIAAALAVVWLGGREVARARAEDAAAITGGGLAGERP